jgi:hypothetical protein
MKPFLLWVCSLCLASSLWGQANADQAPSSHTAQPAPQTATPGPASAADYITWRLQRMRQLEDEIGTMRTKLDELKANASHVKDPTARKQMELETDLLGMMLSHAEEVNAMLRLPSPPMRTNSAAQTYRRRLTPRQMPGQPMPAPTPGVQSTPTGAPTGASGTSKSAPPADNQ